MLCNEVKSAHLVRVFFSILTIAALSACGGVSVVGHADPASPKPPASPVETPPDPARPAPGSAPTISGSPANAVATGAGYSFTPAAADPEGRALSFSISNRPAWAEFSIATGALTGTPPADSVGNYASIVITVSNGAASAALPPFSITVSGPFSATGLAALSWLPPTQNTDGSALSDLAGYRIYHGTSAGTLDDVREITNPATTSMVIADLIAGTHYFAISAYSTTGVESILSAVASKTIP